MIENSHTQARFDRMTELLYTGRKINPQKAVEFYEISKGLK